MSDSLRRSTLRSAMERRQAEERKARQAANYRQVESPLEEEREFDVFSDDEEFSDDDGSIEVNLRDVEDEPRKLEKRMRKLTQIAEIRQLFEESGLSIEQIDSLVHAAFRELKVWRRIVVNDPDAQNHIFELFGPNRSIWIYSIIDIAKACMNLDVSEGSIEQETLVSDCMLHTKEAVRMIVSAGRAAGLLQQPQGTETELIVLEWAAFLMAAMVSDYQDGPDGYFADLYGMPRSVLYQRQGRNEIRERSTPPQDEQSETLVGKNSAQQRKSDGERSSRKSGNATRSDDRLGCHGAKKPERGSKENPGFVDAMIVLQSRSNTDGASRSVDIGRRNDTRNRMDDGGKDEAAINSNAPATLLESGDKTTTQSSRLHSIAAGQNGTMAVSSEYASPASANSAAESNTLMPTVPESLKPLCPLSGGQVWSTAEQSSSIAALHENEGAESSTIQPEVQGEAKSTRTALISPLGSFSNDKTKSKAGESSLTPAERMPLGEGDGERRKPYQGGPCVSAESVREMWMGVLLDGDGKTPVFGVYGKNNGSTIIADLVSDPHNLEEIESLHKLMLVSEGCVEAKQYEQAWKEHVHSSKTAEIQHLEEENQNLAKQLHEANVKIRVLEEFMKASMVRAS